MQLFTTNRLTQNKTHEIQSPTARQKKPNMEQETHRSSLLLEDEHFGRVRVLLHARAHRNRRNRWSSDQRGTDAVEVGPVGDGKRGRKVKETK